MISQVSLAFRSALSQLKRRGFLLLSDSNLPSVTTLFAGRPLRGSWWGHPRGHDIFRVVCGIADHPDVAEIKLISGKVTFVHRKLWPALLAIATAREPWQMKGLSRKGRDLLQIVDRKGEVQTDRLPATSKKARSAWNDAVRELEEKLLIYAEEFHSETGAHAKRLESWKHWANRLSLALGKMATHEAKRILEERARRIAGKSTGKAKLPWMKMEAAISMKRIPHRKVRN